MNALKSQGALVLLSGGQDSTTCLAWALNRFARVETVGFDYRQRHQVELTCRTGILERFRRAWSTLGPDHIVDLAGLGAISETALTRDQEVVLGEHGLPTSFVPGRNVIFLGFSAAIAYRRGLKSIVAGMCETDYSGYPDCRDQSLKALQVAIGLCMARDIVFHTPLMWLDKAATWAMAQAEGGQELVDFIRRATHTCYLGDHSTWHDWGFGCGTCPACEIRRSGWEKFTEGM